VSSPPTRVARPPHAHAAARLRHRAGDWLIAGVLVGWVLAGLAGCSAPWAAPSPVRSGGPAEVIRAGLADGIPLLRPRVLAQLWHGTDTWTEGLELADGVLYEGTGLPGASQLRELDPSTGRVLRAAAVPNRWYGEGIAVLGGTIWQLTYTDHVALRWDRRTLTPGAPVRYPGEGWGLCHLPDRTGAPVQLVASDGSDRLRLLAGADLRQLGSVAVLVAGRPLRGLNGLDCQPDAVWANVYQTDYLVRVDLATGSVTAIVDASALAPPSADPESEVLNGIAAVPGTDQFLLTGKYWPTLFRVEFMPAK
jgi:glutaminyl-peptide cyclotransferase